MNYPIADLHCDLLSYLEADPEHAPFNRHALCSIPQLREGNVHYQVLAVFAKTGFDSVQKGMAQIDLYKQLPSLCPDDIIHFEKDQIDASDRSKIKVLLALEGASTFCDENEPLEQGLNRLQFVIDTVAKPLYISLTWNMENRFGGGALTQSGLKEDGKRLLDYLHDKGIALDFSHASDALAYDVFEYIDLKEFNIPVMASHSNLRSVTSVSRNLPDEIAEEIFLRKGIIGINFYRPFVGSEPDDFVKHLSRLIHLGKGTSQICFGADFFFEEGKNADNYFSDYCDASCYPDFLNLCRKRMDFTNGDLENLCFRNFLSYLAQNDLATGFSRIDHIE